MFIDVQQLKFPLQRSAQQFRSLLFRRHLSYVSRVDTGHQNVCSIAQKVVYLSEAMSHQ